MYLLHLDDSWSRDLTREKQGKKVGYKLITSDNMIGFWHELKRKGVEFSDSKRQTLSVHFERSQKGKHWQF